MDPERLPNLFIIGAVKAGTTTLYDTLQEYPEVYFPVQKEPSFFCDEEYYRKGIDWYQDTFYERSAGYPIRGDASPRYLFWSSRAAPRIASMAGDSPPKFIAIFRSPVEMVYSFYWQSIREGREVLPFRDALRAEPSRLAEYQEINSRKGRLTYAYQEIAGYASQLQPFLDRFPRERFLFLVTEDFRDFPALTCRLEEFLDLKHMDWPAMVRSNVSRLPRSRWLQQMLIKPSRLKDVFKSVLPYSVRHRLKRAAMDLNLKTFQPEPLAPDLVVQIREHYAPEIRALEKIIGRDLSTWYAETQPDV